MNKREWEHILRILSAKSSSLDEEMLIPHDDKPDDQSVTDFIPPNSCSHIVDDPPVPSEEEIEKIEQIMKY